MCCRVRKRRSGAKWADLQGLAGGQAGVENPLHVWTEKSAEHPAGPDRRLWLRTDGHIWRWNSSSGGWIDHVHIPSAGLEATLSTLPKLLFTARLLTQGVTEQDRIHKGNIADTTRRPGQRVGGFACWDPVQNRSKPGNCHFDCLQVIRPCDPDRMLRHGQGHRIFKFLFQRRVMKLKLLEVNFCWLVNGITPCTPDWVVHSGRRASMSYFILDKRMSEGTIKRALRQIEALLCMSQFIQSEP